MNKEILRITDLGTVCSCDKTIDMLTNKFLKKLEKNYQSDAYNVSYNEKDNNFNIKYDGIEYILELDSDTMKNYIEGKYNDITLRLKKITMAELDLNKRKEEELKLKKAEEEAAIEREKIVKKIIEEAERGIIPNNEARTIYLNKLKKDKKFPFKKLLFNIFKQSHEDNETHRDNVGEIIYEHSDGIGEFIIFDGIFLAVIVSGITLIIENFLIAFSVIDDLNINLLWKLALGGFFLPSAIFLYPVATYFYNLVKNTIKHIKNKRLIKHKIKELKKALKYPEHKSIAENMFDKTLEEPIKKYSYDFQDYILQYISDLLDKIKYLNYSDKIRLNKSIAVIYKEYKEKLNKIPETNTIEDFCGNNIIELQNSVKNKLAKIEIEITQIRISDITEEEKQKEFSIIEERLGPIVIDSEVIDGTLREREKNIITIPTGRARTKEYNYRKTL